MTAKNNIRNIGIVAHVDMSDNYLLYFLFTTNYKICLANTDIWIAFE